MSKPRGRPPSGKVATTITVNANREYVGYLNALAALRGESIGALVRKAIDAQYGESLNILANIEVGQNNGLPQS